VTRVLNEVREFGRRFRLVLASTGVGSLLLLSSCGREYPIFEPTILEGGVYAHVVHLPAAFVGPEAEPESYRADTYYSLALDQLEFGLPRDSSATLLVGAIRGRLPSLPSANAFAIHYQDAYKVTEVPAIQWQEARKVNNPEVRNPDRDYVGVRRTPKGFQYPGQFYPARGEGNCVNDSSKNGSLVLIGCQKLKKTEQPNPFFVDVFDGETGLRIASADLNYPFPNDDSGSGRRSIVLLDPNWVAITLSQDLRTILLFDFKPYFDQKQSTK
jgi:hypothetical protein